jgi:hypothetical protein
MRARYPALLLLAWGCARFDRSVVDLDGHARDVSGTAVLLFLSPGCPIANRYVPEVTRIAGRFAGRVNWWLVYPDASAAEARAHVAEYKLTLPVVRDPKHALVRRAGVEVTPEAALMRDGKIAWHGRIDDRFADVATERPQATTHDLEDAVAALVDGKPLPAAAPAVGCAIERR